jgi:hypothetical protein
VDELLLLALLFLVGDGGGSPSPTHVPTSRADLDAVLAELPPSVDADMRDFLRLVALRESGFDRLHGAGSTVGAPPDMRITPSSNEALQAARAYDRRASKLRGPWPRARYAWGTGGWFGLMPANAVAAYGDGQADVDPWAVADPHASVIMALGMVHRLQKHEAYRRDPTFARLRAGWAGLGRMADDAWIAGRIAAWSADARRAGVDAALLGRRPQAVPERTDWF